MTDVVHVISGLGTGGAETMLVQLAIALRARGLSQHVFGLSKLDTRASDLRAAGIDVTVLNTDGPVSFAKALVGLSHVAKRLRPRILQGWMYHGNVAATLCHYLYGGRAERKLLWNLRASNMDADRYGRVVRLSVLLSRLPDMVVANSEAGAAFHRGCGFRAKRMVVIENGVDINKFRPDPTARENVRSELGLRDDAVVAIHVARVDPMKDHASFLAAIACVPTVTGIMIGSGTESLDMPFNVRALGERRDVERLMQAADVVASSSAFGEGFSNAIAEGMSAGLVPIATDVGDARHIVGDAGSIVPPRDSAAFAQALAEIGSEPADARRQMGLKARERVVSHFSLELAVERYFDLYTAPIPVG
jgi:glycosyltransferase involved in cell wall biosynthesis